MSADVPGTPRNAMPSGSGAGDSAVPSGAAEAAKAPVLDAGTYEVLRQRLSERRSDLETRLQSFDERRKHEFGAVEMRMERAERVATENSCVPRDMVALGEALLFGYNVQFGLKTETALSDVFALYAPDGSGFKALPLDPLSDPRFLEDFRNLYRYYRQTVFSRFALQGATLFMVFQVGSRADDIKVFKWQLADGRLSYQGDRSAQEYRPPPQHEFEWTRTRREFHREGLHPHISIEDRLFVETIGGDLTIKVENNTASGEGIYTEPVQNRDQTLDDAEIHYAIVGSLILLRIRPFQEKDFRHLVFFEKTRQVKRIDAIGSSCVLLPEEQGIIFPTGYALQSGEYRVFETAAPDRQFDTRLSSPGAEDHLFAFHDAATGEYTLYSYRITEQKTEVPLACHGYCILPSGTMTCFRAEGTPQRSHVLQIWKTPFAAAALPAAASSDPWMARIGNKEAVRFLANGRKIVRLLGREASYAGLYSELARASRDLSDSHFWLKDEDVGGLAAVLDSIRTTSDAAIGEFEKVERARLRAAEELAALRASLEAVAVENPVYSDLAVCIDAMTRLREGRGRLLAIRDLPQADLGAVAAYEARLVASLAAASNACIALLLDPASLDPHRAALAAIEQEIAACRTTAQAGALEEKLGEATRQLELLLEIVGTLPSSDPTRTTAILEAVSVLLAGLNQVRGALRERRQSLSRVESAAEFAAQQKLLAQELSNALESGATPEACEQAQNRLMVRIEELEGKFAEVEEFVVALADRRNELIEAFEARKIALREARGRRAAVLAESANRVLQGVRQRAESLKTVDEVRTFFASDLLAEKVRQLVRQLEELGETGRAEEILGKFKTQNEEALRRIRDRSELYAEDGKAVRIGRHLFAVNGQKPELVLIRRDDRLALHITGTAFFQSLDDPEIERLRPVWDLESAAESPQVYRAEFLAHRILAAARGPAALTGLASAAPADLLVVVRAEMERRLQDGYLKGVHDEDAAAIVREAARVAATAGPMRFPGEARALAFAFWNSLSDESWKSRMSAVLAGVGAIERAFPGARRGSALWASALRTLEEALSGFARGLGESSEAAVAEAAECLAEALAEGAGLVLSEDARVLLSAFEAGLAARGGREAFSRGVEALAAHPAQRYRLVREWLRGFVASGATPVQPASSAPVASSASAPIDGAALDEAAAALFVSGGASQSRFLPVVRPVELTLRGSHPLVRERHHVFEYVGFRRRLREHEERVAPAFAQFAARRKALLEAARERLALDSLRPRVLASFVRNRLIDEVYLPLIGDNFAKQLGAAGDGKRADRMGLLLLISPPGYGKTTLVEYLCECLGLLFVKINGPTLGRSVVSLDPALARDAGARTELERLNLALEMGDNALILLDDIQHCNPEFLQKFISLCDAQRRMEGVFDGKPRSYDLRGRRIAVVMAGNPYTESGEAFRIPDMLANRADTFNLGDIAGRNDEAFRLSYLENAMTANPALARVFGRERRDFVALLREGGSAGAELSGTYSAEDLAEARAVAERLVRVRDAVLAVNRQYMDSATQAEEFRVEPQFKLQGSYRNMAKLAEKVAPMMTEDEVRQLLLAHYRDESQSLAKDAEASLLKLKELLGVQADAEARRWDEIKATWQRNRGGSRGKAAGQALAELQRIGQGLVRIGAAIERHVAPATPRSGEPPAASRTGHSPSAARHAPGKKGDDASARATSPSDAAASGGPAGGGGADLDLSVGRLQDASTRGAEWNIAPPAGDP